MNKINWIILFASFLLSLAAILYVLNSFRLNRENSKKVNAEVTWVRKSRKGDIGVVREIIPLFSYGLF